MTWEHYAAIGVLAFAGIVAWLQSRKPKVTTKAAPVATVATVPVAAEPTGTVFDIAALDRQANLRAAEILVDRLAKDRALRIAQEIASVVGGDDQPINISTSHPRS